MIMLATITLAVSLWVSGESLGVQPVLAAMIGLCVLLFTGERAVCPVFGACLASAAGHLRGPACVCPGVCGPVPKAPRPRGLPFGTMPAFRPALQAF